VDISNVMVDNVQHDSTLRVFTCYQKLHGVRVSNTHDVVVESET